MEFKDKSGEIYDIEIMMQGSKDQKYITNIINSLWENADKKLFKDYLSIKYSPDELPTTFVVKKNQEMVAFCCLLRNDLMYRSDITPWFGNCYVFEEFRNRGLMKFMQQYVCEHAKNKGYKKIFLWTENNKLYTNCGWKYLEKINVNADMLAYLFYKDL